MRFVFMDEAGTSAHEPVTVVVGLIANADSHVMRAEALAHEALGAVPDEFKKAFVFHATQIFGDSAYQKVWSLTDRLHLLKAMMSIPRRLGMAITVAASWKAAIDFSDEAASIGLSAAQFTHLLTFGDCIAVADRNIRRHAGPSEVATVVAEDVPEMRRHLKKVPMFWRENSFSFSPDQMRTTAKDEVAGHSVQSGDMRVTRIRKSVHFVEKSEDPLVQIADACAYGFRRFFAGQKFGEDFVSAIVGDHRIVSHFASPGGAECWWPNSESQA